MRIHKEGYRILGAFFILFALLVLLFNLVFPGRGIIHYIFYLLVFSTYLLFVFFFRVPARKNQAAEGKIICPADGKVVVIEEIEDKVFFKDRRIQVSVFMSPLDVHVNWYPVTGVIRYYKYDEGSYLVAWHPKSSLENERTTIVLETDDHQLVLVRQIAGAVARRIVCYAEENVRVDKCNHLGFIKFGSRVDLLLPVGSKIEVKLNQKVRGGETLIGSFA